VKNKEYILYRGAAFTIEWYYTVAGESQALDYFSALDTRRQNELLKLAKRMGDSGKISDFTKFRNEGDKIFAFKAQPDRYLCFFFTGKKIVITNAFHKKSQKLPNREKTRALNAKHDYEFRFNQGAYYEN
jgi:phage-related protein